MHALVLALIAAQTMAADVRIGVLPTTGDNVPPDLDRAIAAFLFEREGAKPVEPEVIRRKLGQAKKLGLSCAPLDAECLLRLAILVELDMLVEARVQGDRFEVVIADALHRELKPKGRGTLGEDRVRDVRVILASALDGEAALDVVRADGARPVVTIDDAPVKSWPATGLKPGLHDVVIDQTLKRAVSLDAGVLERLVVEAPAVDGREDEKHDVVTPPPPAPKPKGASPIAVGAGVVAGAMLVGGAATTLGAFLSNETFLDPTKDTDARNDAQALGQGLVVASVALFALGAAAATTSAVLFIE